MYFVTDNTSLNGEKSFNGYYYNIFHEIFKNGHYYLIFLSSRVWCLCSDCRCRCSDLHHRCRFSDLRHQCRSSDRQYRCSDLCHQCPCSDCRCRCSDDVVGVTVLIDVAGVAVLPLIDVTNVAAGITFKYSH